MMKISVSHLSNYVFCPRSVYMSGFLKVRPADTPELLKGLLGHELRKELCLRQMSLVGIVHEPKEVGVALRAAYSEIAAKKESPYLSEVRSEIFSEIDSMQERLSLMAKSLGFDDAFKRVTPWKVDYPVSSENLKIKGRIDKVMNDKIIHPVEIKTCSPSETVWDADRVQVCAYSMLLEEKLGVKIPYGFVEYARINEKRPVMNTGKLREKVLVLRDETEEVLAGRQPDICPHGNGKKCASCSYADKCYAV